MTPTSGQAIALAHSLEQVTLMGLRARTLSGISDILTSIATELNAFGCVLWEASRDLDYSQSEGSFYALAQYFRNKAVWREHDVAARSATGFALSRGAAPFNVTDINSESFRALVYRSPFLEKHDITRACVFPITFADNARGAINLYRQAKEEPFSELDVRRGEQMAHLLPYLYETIRDEVAYRLTTDINRKLQGTNLDLTNHLEYRASLDELAANICLTIAENLHCIDVSLFLHRESDSGGFDCIASTSARGLALKDKTLALDAKAYSAVRQGLTYRVADVSRGGESGAGSNNFAAHIERLLNEKRPDTPLSMIVAPILAAGLPAFGAIRCCGTFDGPTYFGPREEDLLHVLGGQVGQFMSDAQNRWKLSQENRAWSAISETLDQMRIGRGSSAVNKRSVLVEAVDAITRGFNAQASVVIQMDSDDSIGSQTFGTGRNSTVSSRIQGLHGSGAGTLRLTYSKDSPLAGVFQKIANLLGLQLSGYYQLASMAEGHRQALMSFQHQIRAPLRHAVRRFPNASRAARRAGDPGLHKQIQFLHGITRRAYRIAMTMHLFSRLESGLPVEAALKETSVDDLHKLLVEAVMDNNAIGNPSRAIQFIVERSTFEPIAFQKVEVDRNLFDQAINDLLDNAGKYSFNETRVVVEARTTKAFCVITIANIGLRIGPEQVQEVVKKGVRGVLAKADIAEGEGLGLWIVGEIMKAHGGRVEIVATTPDPENLTKVCLWFPLSRSK